MRNRAVTRDREAGVALLSAILVLMLMSAILVGFITMVNTDQAASGINRDQTQAYAAAHAGVEKLTSDLGNYFQTNFAPTGAQIAALHTVAKQPTLPGIQYLAPSGAAGSGYRISFTDGPVPPADGNPDLEDPNGSTITAGPYEGLVGLITPYNIEVSARTTGGAEVRMRRVMQTVAIPVFQFGIFSENDLSFFAGPNFAFGGRIHTNQHLFLKQDTNATLTLQDRVTAVGEVIRSHLANGVTGSHPGEVRVARAAGCAPAPAAINASCRDLADTEGSLVTTIGSAQNEPTWTNLSTGAYNQWLRNGRTGARRLDLPVVSDGARPIDLIRRPPAGELPTSSVGQQRFYNMATLRILVSDTRAEIMNLPGVVANADSPIPLQGTLNVSVAEAGNANNIAAGNHPFAAAPAMPDAVAVTTALNNGFRTTAGTSSIGGYILINRQDRSGTWTDVTKEVLNLGFSGRRLSNPLVGAPANYDFVPNFANDCVNPHRNAIIRFQRLRDSMVGGAPGCGGVSMNATDYWPNVLYDPREGMLRDDNAGRPVAPGGAPTFGYDRLFWGGVMHYVELDVNNLRRWLRGDLGGTNSAACINGAGPATCPMDVTGFVVYFSDRRTNKGPGNDAAVTVAPTVTGVAATVSSPSGSIEVTYGDDAETGELGYEDIINTNASSQRNGALDHPFVDAAGNNRFSEDLNWEPPSVAAANAPGRGTLERYGSTARLLPVVGAAAVPPFAANQMLRVPAGNLTPSGVPTATVNDAAGANYTLYGSVAGAWGVPIDRMVARVNRAFFFRRALKLVNGGRGELPANGSQGLTVAAENPVYIEGEFNACTNNIDQLTNAGTGVPRANVGNGWLTAAGSCAGGVGFGATPGVDHVSAAVIADSVSFLSTAWNDIASFNNPHDVDRALGAAPTWDAEDNDVRMAQTTWYRTAVISGKGLNFPRANTTPQAYDGADWGTDGGAHNFLRYIEDWNNGAVLNYRGSIVSFYTARQAVGIYKCCNVVYTPPTRGYNFDTEFLQPTLLPPRTPMFRDINTLTFRQVLRPTQ